MQSSLTTTTEQLPTGSRERRPCARRWTCWLQDQTKVPPDALTSQSTRTCLRREVPADHATHSQAQRRQLPSESARTRPLEPRRHSIFWSAPQKPKRTTKHVHSLTLALAKSGPRVASRRHKPERPPQLWNQQIPRAARGGERMVLVQQPSDHTQHVE